ncbi:MAG: flagellum-specific ATP synthase FliI, partial [Betaproteobacteria bacterium]|nr:flagellum-specific ATP synthase FliI [Betaproteobacteria bacterium]
LYQTNAELIQVGAYQAGTNPELDEAIRLHERLKAFLQQDMHQRVGLEQTRAELLALISAP